MSVNRFIRDKKDTPEELELIASRGQRVFVGTKAAVEAALKAGDIGNASVVYITDDYQARKGIKLIADDCVNESGKLVATNNSSLTTDGLVVIKDNRPDEWVEI